MCVKVSKEHVVDHFRKVKILVEARENIAKPHLGLPMILINAASAFFQDTWSDTGLNVEVAGCGATLTPSQEKMYVKIWANARLP